MVASVKKPYTKEYILYNSVYIMLRTKEIQSVG